MSRVFLAEEVELRRKVVVKVLPPEMAAGVNQDRFRREIQLAAGLQHPHIVPVHSAGSSGDLLWYTMPFIEGESLRTRLAKGGELPIKDALLVLREVADALAYAHSKGVVHRDIKPDNVMLSGKHALVTDFGVAKAVSESTGRQSLTSMGIALGTPSYMAPEQAAAEPNVDHRADLYAFGAMAYEMLAGRPPFTGMTAQAVLAAQVTQTPDAVTGLRPAIPEALGGLVMRCLEKRPADRWQTAEELIPHLEALLTPSGGSSPTSATMAVSSGTEAALRRAHPMRVGAQFALVAVVVLGAVWWVVQQIGLPSWVFLGAIGLMFLGLPVMLYASRAERKHAMARATGMMTATPAGALAPVSTLRGAMMGGVLAFGALGLGAAGFMFLRAQGIGPFATLMTSGALNQRDPIIIADFENRTADSLLGQSVTEALRIDLTRSTVIRVAQAGDITATLSQMRRDPNTPLTESVAREVAERRGAGAVVVGEITPLGAGFSLSARVVSVAGGETLLAERETAQNTEEIIGAVDRLSRKLREGIGESLRTIRAGQPLLEVTTGSLEALRLYTQAERAMNRGDYQEGERRLKQALEIDSAFAMAWRKLAVVFLNTNQSFSLVIDASRKAFQLRDRLPDRERLHAAAYYYYNVEYDSDRVIDTYRQLLASWPEDDAALNNLGIELNSRRRFEEAEPLLRRMVEYHPEAAVGYANLIISLGNQGKRAAEDSVLEAMTGTGISEWQRWRFAQRVAFARGDYGRSLALSDSLEETSEELPRRTGERFRAAVLQSQGRMGEASRWLRTLAEAQRARGVPARYFVDLMDASLIEAAFLGRGEDARRTIDSVLSVQPLTTIEPEDRPYLSLAEFYYRLGEVTEGDRLLMEYDLEMPEYLRTTDENRQFTDALAALAKGNPEKAVPLLYQYRNGTFACRLCGLMELGQAFDALGQPDSALAAYEALHTTPTVGIQGQQWTLAQSSIRLGELYESRGDKAKALEYYGKFVDLWKNADPELQPRVREIRARIAKLAGEPGS